MESFGRVEVEGSNFIDELATSVMVGPWQGRGGEGTPAPNRLADRTGRDVEEDVALQAPG